MADNYTRSADGKIVVALKDGREAVLADLTARQAHYADQLATTALVVMSTRALCSLTEIGGVRIHVYDETTLGLALDLLGTADARDRVTIAFGQSSSEAPDLGKSPEATP